jgi:hypothetical protein
MKKYTIIKWETAEEYFRRQKKPKRAKKVRIVESQPSSSEPQRTRPKRCWWECMECDHVHDHPQPLFLADGPERLLECQGKCKYKITLHKIYGHDLYAEVQAHQKCKCGHEAWTHNRLHSGEDYKGHCWSCDRRPRLQTCKHFTPGVK